MRDAAAGWQRSGAIDAATKATIDKAYPDDRSRLGPAFRTLVFVFAVVGLLAFFLFWAVATSSGAVAGISALLYGTALLALTEVQLGVMKRSGGGTEEATGLVGLGFLLAGFAWALERAGLGSGGVWTGFLLLATAVLATTAVRWGSALLAGAATGAFFLLLARAPFGRALWLAVPLALTPWLLKGAESRGLPPSLRRSCQVALAVALVALYLSVQVSSWDKGFIESLSGPTLSLRESRLRPLAVVLTALVPVGILVAGIRMRLALLLNVGLLLLTASIVTLRFYVHVAPLWVVLAGSGVLAVCTALAIARLLDSGDEKARGGFTAEPLFEDPNRGSRLEIAAALVSFSPAARKPAPVEGRFEGGGGQSGGGGTSDSF